MLFAPIKLNCLRSSRCCRSKSKKKTRTWVAGLICGPAAEERVSGGPSRAELCRKAHESLMQGNRELGGRRLERRLLSDRMGQPAEGKSGPPSSAKETLSSPAIHGLMASQ